MAKQPVEIAIFAPDSDDPQAMAVADAVRDRGAIAHIVPATVDSEQTQLLAADCLVCNGVDLSRVRAVYLRSITLSTPTLVPGYLSRAEWAAYRARFMFEAQRQAFVFSILEALAEQQALVVNVPHTYQAHASKAAMYLALSNAGFSVPETLMTSDPTVAASFVTQFPAVAKPGAGIGSTRAVSEADQNRLHEVQRAPTLFQRKIEGTTIRVHVVGQQAVLALRIKSREMDSRTRPKGFSVVNLPPDVSQKIVAATHLLGAHFAAWDVLHSDDGGYFLLDFNPGPYIMWIGETAARAVLAELATMLLTYGQTQSLEKAYAAPQTCQLPHTSWDVEPNPHVQAVLDRTAQRRRQRLRISE